MAIGSYRKEYMGEGNSEHKQLIIDRIKYLKDIVTEDDMIAELRRCSADPIHFIDHWAWTYDPTQEEAKLLPFVLFPRQRDYVIWLLDRLEKRKPGVVPKCRQVGMSWVSVAFGVWMLIFRKNINITYTSMKVTLTDKKGDPKSLFAKARKLIDMLPPWMKPAINDPVGIIQNMDNGSTLTADGGDNPGRGGTSTMIFADEFSGCVHQEKVDAAISANSDVIIYMSTFSRPGNLFYRIATGQERNVERFDFGWKDDPRKTQEWYDDLRRTKGAEWIAREIDCDPHATVAGQLIKKEWIDAAVELGRLIEITNKSIPSIAGYDPAGSGQGCEFVMVRRRGPLVTNIDAFRMDDTDLAAQKAVRMASDCSMLLFDADGGYGNETRSAFARINNSNITVIPFSGSGGSTEIGIFNRRAQAYWNLKRKFKNSYDYQCARTQPDLYTGNKPDIMDCIAIPQDGLLIEQLLSIKSKEREDGKILIESKKDMIARGIKSPDRADALNYCFASEILRGGAKSY